MKPRPGDTWRIQPIAPAAFINAIGTAVPGHDIHQPFLAWAESQLTSDTDREIFRRMARRSGISHRWSVLPKTNDNGSPVEPGGFYAEDNFPTTSVRMQLYADEAPNLALEAIRTLSQQANISVITHLIVASCTGFIAPGFHQSIVARLNG